MPRVGEQRNYLKKYITYTLDAADPHGNAPPIYHHHEEILAHLPSIISANGSLTGNLAGSVQNGQVSSSPALVNQQPMILLLPSSPSGYGAYLSWSLPSLIIDPNMSNSLAFSQFKQNALLLPDQAGTHTLPPYASFIWARKI